MPPYAVCGARQRLFQTQRCASRAAVPQPHPGAGLRHVPLLSPRLREQLLELGLGAAEGEGRNKAERKEKAKREKCFRKIQYGEYRRRQAER